MSQTPDPQWETTTHPDGRITFTTAHDRLYDPEGRAAQRNFVIGVPADDEKMQSLVSIWRCGVPEHGECWSTSHLSTREVGMDCASHTSQCSCWRHSILAWAREQRRMNY